MPIRRLPPEAVNRIAAGEVIERPAAAVKELVENALDAGAKRIAVRIERGGLGLISVEDDGCGVSREELPLAVERHATSKLQAGEGGDVDLLNIHTMGFRGEALPSIGAVARLSITSRAQGAAEAWTLDVEGGALHPARPAAWAALSESGTRVEVRDLFFATPARLKFMKSERAEMMAVSEVLKRLAMARPDVAFSLEHDGRVSFRYAAEADPENEGRRARLAAILGADFAPNCIALDQRRADVRLSGFAGLPTFHRGTREYQHLFVNGRPVKDKLIVGAVRAAYQDLLARDRHPVAALFLDLPAGDVDVNVHPAKTEVRFRDAALVRGLIVGALSHALAGAGHRASTTTSATIFTAASLPSSLTRNVSTRRSACLPLTPWPKCSAITAPGSWWRCAPSPHGWKPGRQRRHCAQSTASANGRSACDKSSSGTACPIPVYASCTTASSTPTANCLPVSWN